MHVVTGCAAAKPEGRTGRAQRRTPAGVLVSRGDRAMDRPLMPINPRSATRSRLVAEAKYRDLRLAAFQDAMSALAVVGVDADLRPINAAALAAIGQWTTRRVAWPWHVMAADWRRNHPDRFEVAVWRDGVLCGLALDCPAPAAAHLALTTSKGPPIRRTLCAAR